MLTLREQVNAVRNLKKRRNNTPLLTINPSVLRYRFMDGFLFIPLLIFGLVLYRLTKDYYRRH